MSCIAAHLWSFTSLLTFRNESKELNSVSIRGSIKNDQDDVQCGYQNYLLLEVFRRMGEHGDLKLGNSVVT